MQAHHQYATIINIYTTLAKDAGVWVSLIAFQLLPRPTQQKNRKKKQKHNKEDKEREKRKEEIELEYTAQDMSNAAIIDRKINAYTIRISIPM